MGVELHPFEPPAAQVSDAFTEREPTAQSLSCTAIAVTSKDRPIGSAFASGPPTVGDMGCPAEISRRPRVYDAPMRQKAIAVVVASCVLLAACDGSGSDSDTSTTTSATPAPTSVATTTEPPALSTDAPTTTIDPEAQLAAAEQAYLDAFDAYIAAARDPSNPALRAEIERLHTGPNLKFTISQLDGFVGEGWVARPADPPSSTTILAAPQFLPGRTDFVELVACAVDTEQFVEPGGAPDGTDALVTDEVTVRRVLVRLLLIDGQWRSDSGEILAELSSPEECEP